MHIDILIKDLNFLFPESKENELPERLYAEASHYLILLRGFWRYSLTEQKLEIISHAECIILAAIMRLQSLPNTSEALKEAVSQIEKYYQQSFMMRRRAHPSFQARLDDYYETACGELFFPAPGAIYAPQQRSFTKNF